MTKQTPPLGRAGLLAYAMGSFGTGVFTTVPSVLLLFYCTEVVRIPAAWASVAVFLPKVWGIVWDPLVGSWSDKAQTRFGRRRPFLLAGTIGVAISFYALFSTPGISGAAAFAWVALSYFALASLYSLFAVPYIALPAEIGVTKQLRSRMVSWRIAVAMIGVLAGAGIAPLVIAAGGGGRPGYRFMALWLSVCCVFAMSMPLFILHNRDVANQRHFQSEKPSLMAQMSAALRHRAFRALTLSYVVQLTAVGIISSATPYLVTRAFGRSESDIGIALLVMLSATTVTVPLWAWLGRKFGERNMLVWATFAFAAAAALLGALTRFQAPWPFALAGFLMAGVPFAGMQVLPFTLLAHLIHEKTSGGSAAEATLTGMWTASEKLGLALGPALTGVALTAMHGGIVHGLGIFVLLVPTLLAVLCVPLLLRVRIESSAALEPFDSRGVAEEARRRE
ncbi:MAG: MFS transporter [Rhizomicrobium sp.]